MNKLLTLIGGVILVAVVAIIVWIALPVLNPPDATSTTFDPAQLPADGLHIATSQPEGTENIVRVEIIANVPQRAAGFDLAVNYPADAVRPLNTPDELPAAPGSLFVGAEMARNEVVSLSDEQGQVRMMYVFFGDQSGAVGAGTLAVMDFELLPGAESAVIELQNPRLSRINAEGVAEYVPLSIGDPTLTLEMTAQGVQPSVGAAPMVDQTTTILAVAIGLIVIALLGLATLGLRWRSSRKPKLATSAR